VSEIMTHFDLVSNKIRSFFCTFFIPFLYLIKILFKNKYHYYLLMMYYASLLCSLGFLYIYRNDLTNYMKNSVLDKLILLKINIVEKYKTLLVSNNQQVVNVWVITNNTLINITKFFNIHNLDIVNEINEMINNNSIIIVEYSVQNKTYKVAFENTYLGDLKNIFPLKKINGISQYPFLSAKLEYNNQKTDILDILKQYSGINNNFYSDIKNTILTPEVLVNNNKLVYTKGEKITILDNNFNNKVVEDGSTDIL
jgi:hypothetical protein